MGIGILTRKMKSREQVDSLRNENDTVTGSLEAHT